MIELSTLQAVREIVTIVGVVAGLSYYILTVKNQNRTRQIQLLSQFSKSTSEEVQKRSIELIALEWSDYDDFERKYGSDNNPDNYGIRYAAWSGFNQLGYLLKQGLIKIEQFQGIYAGAGGPMWMWHKFGSIIKEQRRRYNLPFLFVWFEYLANELIKDLERRGHTNLIPENYASHIPDE